MHSQYLKEQLSRCLPLLQRGIKGDSMPNYHPRNGLKYKARILRTNMTDSEQTLWARIRRKQLAGVQFYRQRPIGRYIVDFYAPQARLVIELDGAQHLEPAHVKKDIIRDAYLLSIGYHVLRFNNIDVLKMPDVVVDVIYKFVLDRVNPPYIPL